MKRHFFLIAALCLGSTAASADCKLEMETIMQTMMHAGPYHVSMATVADGGKTTNIEADVILPTSEHLKMGPMEIVILPSGTWMKTGGTWRSAPGPLGANLLNSMTQSIKGMRSDIVCGSTGEFDGHSYPVYKFNSTGDAMGVKTSSQITLYKGANGLPVGLIVDGMAMGGHSVTTQHIKFDPSITIAAPQ